MRTSPIDFINSRQLRKDVTPFRAGDQVRVHWKVKEGEKERVQPFEGVVIRKTKGSVSASFTVRKVSYGVGVERIFPLHSPRYEKIEVLTHGKVHRSRLFYLRDLVGKASRVDTQDELENAPGSNGNAKAAAPAAPEAPSQAPAEAQEAASAEPKAAAEAKPAKKKPAAKAKKKETSSKE